MKGKLVKITVLFDDIIHDSFSCDIQHEHGHGGNNAACKGNNGTCD